MVINEKSFLVPENSLSVLEFLRVAHEYCIYCEKSFGKNKGEVADFMLKICPLLYLKGKLLPEVVPEYPESSERYVTEEEWQEIFNNFRAVFLAEDEYYQVDYEESIEYEAIKVSLSESLTDIYQDLKDFVLLYQKNTAAARQNAVNDCRNLFETRWGPKLLNSLRYMHYLLIRDKLPNGEEV